MGLKKQKIWRGANFPEAHYDIIEIRLILVTNDEGDEVWRVIVKVAMYANADKTELLEQPPKEYSVGEIENTSLISYNKIMDLLKQHPEFIDAVETE